LMANQPLQTKIKRPQDKLTPLNQSEVTRLVNKKVLLSQHLFCMYLTNIFS